MSSLGRSYPNLYPSPPGECELVEVDVASIPMMLRALWTRSWSNNWATPEDATRGRWAMNRAGAQLLMGCAKDLLAAMDRQYRQFDTYAWGTNYSYTGTGTPEDPYVISPAIPVVPPPASAATGESILKTLDTHTLMWYNLMAGYTFPDEDLNDPKTLKQYLAEIAAGSGGDPQLREFARLILITLGGVPPL